jgi:hypothetical protein
MYQLRFLWRKQQNSTLSYFSQKGIYWKNSKEVPVLKEKLNNQAPGRISESNDLNNRIHRLPV